MNTIKEKLVYFVILSWINIDDTVECLKSLEKIQYQNYKVILVNNAAKDISSDIFQQFSKVIIINNKENFGFAKASNQGIQKAVDDKADYIAVLNSDTIVSEDFLDILVNHCEKSPRLVVSPGIFYYHQRDRIENFGGFLIYALSLTKRNQSKELTVPDYLSGACFLAKREVFEDVGLFDEDYWAYLEDCDWSLRAKQKRYKLCVIPESKIWHKHSASTKEGKGWSAIKAFYITRNSLLLAKKNFKGLRKYVWIFCYVALGSPLQILFHCRTFKTFGMHCKGVWSGILNK